MSNREAQASIGTGAPHKLLDLAELAHRALQSGAVELGQLADILRCESLGSLQGLRELRAGAVGSGPVNEGVEVPSRLLELGVR